ncbi:MULTISPECIES: flagellar hook-basal body complex protein FliE [unclassified Halomonas]|uniref:flagellar hook-basal body complex protein FliE n=1 Tax=unclassified Halomonas TaxID=2609666 RepID=UPI002887412A|nr:MULTISPECIES: flagellar hook-basal body complex protein FliE [unclassified Halomonas]MDT0500498.1 flagellar hook-basal body complex protein FliE [Halomonas sp. PAR7]MDT0511606.1 flagellar hook-basal body complex protein FliE [Halomonas sp. LES1]MDT0590106.1 flagellar hook-basal body complex protein FliE [Halomonas sp. PAR8]
MSTPAIESVLSQMQSLASQAAGQAGGQQVDTRVGGGFAGELHDAIHRINDLKLESADTAAAFQAGEPGVELNDVMVDMQKASIASEMGTQVRNRLVTAYKDIMNMQV